MTLHGSRVENVKKIAVLRANALGDFIVTLPALKAIKDTYPDAEIVLLAKPWHKQFLVKGRSPVDRVMVVPVKKGIRTENAQPEDDNETEKFFEAMQQEAFDIAISFQGNGTSANPFIKRLHAKLTVGLWTEGAEKVDRFINYYYYQSETIRYIEVASLIGGHATNLEPALNVLDSDLEQIHSFIETLPHKPFVVLHPVAMDVRRMWPVENYAPVAKELHKRGFEIVFSGSTDDEPTVENIRQQLPFETFSTCGRFGLEGLTALLSKASLMISADTGPLHLARSVNTPTVGIYWAPNLINWGPVTRNIHRPVVSWTMACPYCGVVPNDPYPFEPYTNTCRHEISFVRDVTVNQVLAAAQFAFVDQQEIKSKAITEDVQQ